MTRPEARSILTVLPALFLCLILTLTALPEETQGGFVPRSFAERTLSLMEEARGEALEGLSIVRKTYRLSPGVLAPKPDPEGYGTLHTPEEVTALFDTARVLLDGREPLLQADTPFDRDKGISYYYDESILALSWYQTVTEEDIGWDHDATMAEIFISDASQFRRKLSGDAFGSEKLTYPTDMATEVNAVFASSGDFYRFRSEGLCIMDGEVCRLKAEKLDACAVDENGDLLFIPAGTLHTEEEANAYIREHKISFALSFGPILVENYQSLPYRGFYPLGESDIRYPRLILGQMGRLHYVEMAIRDHITPYGAGEILQKMGVERCYTLDGGQTATLVMQGQALNPNLYGQGNGSQRTQSDIIYFVSAIPRRDQEQQGGE